VAAQSADGGEDGVRLGGRGAGEPSSCSWSPPAPPPPWATPLP